MSNTVRIEYPDLSTNTRRNESFISGDSLEAKSRSDQRSIIEVVEGDTGVSITAGDLNDTIVGGVGGDTINGGTGSDSIDAGAGDDTIEVGSGDTVTGGEGSDTIRIDLSQEIDPENPPVIDDFQSGEDNIVIVDGGEEIPASFDAATGVITAKGQTVLQIGENVAFDDDDLANGVEPRDTSNTVRIEYPDLSTNTRKNESFITGDSLTAQGRPDQRSIIEVVEGEAGVSLIGGDLNDTISGGVGDDTIDGGAGDDLIIGGGGNDSIVGGAGNDTFEVGSGDVISGGEGNDTIEVDLAQEIDPDNLPEVTDFQPGEDEILIRNGEEAVPASFDEATGTITVDGQAVLQLQLDDDAVFDESDLVNGVETSEPEPEPEPEPETETPETPVDETTDPVEVPTETPETPVDETTDPVEVPTDVDGSQTDPDASDTTIFEFFNARDNASFYTVDENEKEFIEENLSNYALQEQPSFSSVDPLTGGAEEVYRFVNNSTGRHLYTTSEVERESIAENLDNYSFEGEKFFGYEDDSVDGSIPVYRLYNSIRDVHVFTADEARKDQLAANDTIFNDEGIAFYAMPADIA